MFIHLIRRCLNAAVWSIQILRYNIQSYNLQPTYIHIHTNLAAQPSCHTKYSKRKNTFKPRAVLFLVLNFTNWLSCLILFAASTSWTTTRFHFFLSMTDLTFNYVFEICSCFTDVDFINISFHCNYFQKREKLSQLSWLSCLSKVHQDECRQCCAGEQRPPWCPREHPVLPGPWLC